MLTAFDWVWKVKEMSDSVLLWSVVAVLLFWTMGAYNRLVRLRSQGLVAYSSLEGLFKQYLLLVKAHCPEQPAAPVWQAATIPGDEDFYAAWAALAAAADQFNASLRVAHSQPLNGPTTSALRTAYETLCLSWSRLRGLASNPVGLALPDGLPAQWDQLGVQAEMARADFNKTVANYNQAIGQFPTFILARGFGFRPAQPI